MMLTNRFADPGEILRGYYAAEPQTRIDWQTDGMMSDGI